MVAHTRTGDKQALKKLSFNEKLVGKGLNTDVVLKKLKALHTELADMDQELVDVSSLNSVRKELISTSIMLHKDRGVKAYAACCLADILRLYAPDAPYTHTELRDIFQFFFRQLSAGLKGSDSSYYNEYFHLLESLSTVKSVVLVCDLPHAEDLMVDIFRDFFGLVRRDLAKKIEMFMADILVALIDECQSLPSDVLESIMAQFMDKNARMDQPAYRLAVTVCNATADKLQRHVCQYFTDIIVSHSRDEEFDEIRTAHDLVKQLSRSCPALLHSVIPQLEEELRVSEVQLRLIATQVLGEMFSDKGGADLVKKYPSTWNVWLQRGNDKAGPVRLKLIEATKGLLVNLPQYREVVEETLRQKLLDPDEKIRAAVCKVYSHLDYEMALHHATEAQLRAVAGRGLDKKHNVRVEALNSIGKLYSLAYPEIESGDPAAIQQFSWIPNEVLRAAAISPEVKAIGEQVLSDFILPLPSSSTPSTSKGVEVDETTWTDRLLNTMKFLDDKATKTLFSMAGIKSNRPMIFDHFISYCEQYNGGIIDENEETITQRLNAIIQRLLGIPALFPDAQKAAEDLHSFAKANEGRLYKLFKTCLDPQTDLKSLVKATNDFLRRVEQSLPVILPTMTVLLRRASLRIVNQSSVPTLVKRIQRGDRSEKQSSTHNAKTILAYISKYCPALYKPHVGELVKAIADEKNDMLVEVCLQALAAVAKWDDKLVPNDKRTTERVMRYVSEANPRHAKYAARLLAFSKKREELCTTVVESISDQLQDADSEQLVAHITVLAQFAKLIPDAFENRSDVITAFLLKEVLMKPSPPDADAMEDDEEWVEDDGVSATLRAKILSLKVCRNRLLAHASSNTALEMSKPVLKLFTTLLEHSGSFAVDTADDPKFRSRLRLQAAVSLLHLSTVDAYANAIAADFIWLAIMVQDPCFQVRMAFLTKLISLLTARKLAPRFNVIPFLTVLDPEAEVKSSAVAYVSYIVRNLPPAIKVEYLETIFIRFLHLLAHHPDFALSREQLSDMKKYIDFYLDLVATSDNVSLLYHLAMKAKTVRDSESHTYSENLYAMSELAQELIKSRTQSNSWSLQSYPGKVKLPSDIFRALPSPEAANKILKTTYLPEETLAELKTKAGTAVKEKRRTEPKELKERKTNAKRKAVVKTNGSTKRSRPAKKWNSDDSDDAEEASDSGSSDGEATAGVEKSESSGDENENRVSALGRGARTRAKERIRKQAGFKFKSKSNPPSSDV